MQTRYNHFILAVLTGILAVLAMLPENAAAEGKRLAVGESVANIRSGPGTKYDVVWRAEQYTPFVIIDQDKTGEWYFCEDFEGSRAWVNKKLLKSLDTVITKKDQCNIRKGPGTNHDIVFEAEKGVPFRVLERKGEWLRVQHADGDTGWINKILVW